MKPLCVPRIRHKAVWGSGRTLAAVAMLVLSVAAPSWAKSGLNGSAKKALPGVPSSRVKNYKLDDEITRRAKNGNPLQTTSAIVTLNVGAQLPAEFRKYARSGSLDIINSYVLDVPNQLLRKLEAHPDIF